MGTTTTSDPAARTTVLGTGAVGRQVATALLTAGHTVTVWNRTPGRLDELAARGAVPAETAAQAAAASELVLLCLTDHDAVHQVLEAAAAGLAGRTLVALTTSSPDEARAAAAQATAAGAGYLDAGLQADSSDLGSPAATVLVSGDPRLFRAHRTALEVLGTVRHVGDAVTAAALHDLVLFGLWYDGQLAVLRALETLRAAGTDVEEFTAAAATQLGHVGGAVADTARELTTGRYPRGPADLTEHAPVLDRLVALRRGLRLGDGDLGRVRELLRRRIEQGHARDGLTGILG